MTKNNLKTSFAFRVVVAALITTAIIFLPAAVLAEGEVDTVVGSTTSGGFDTGGFETGGDSLDAAPDTSSDFDYEPTTDLSTPESGVGDTAPLPEAPAPETDTPPASSTLDQQNGLQEPTPSDTADADVENSEAGDSALEATTDSAGSTVDQLGTSSVPAVKSDAGIEVTTEAGASNQAQYFQVAEDSMSPQLSPGAIVEIVSAAYADGDMVVAQKSDGTYIIKMLDGDQLVSLGAGTNYAAADVNIVGAAALSSLTAEDLELSGLIWNRALAEMSEAPTLGDGTISTPYQIAIWQNLYWLSQTSGAWDKYFEQTAAITFPAAINTWDGGEGWTPIGTVGTPFTGSYNGQGYTISNLYINRPAEDNVGLFGYTNGATLTNIALVDVNVTGHDYVGGLVGYNDGSITNSSATGTVTGTGIDVGGLVGYNDGSITNSSATGAVTGTGINVGGLVGWNYLGSISNSYATGVVTGTNSVGGLAGANYEGTISNSYATGTITGTFINVGGLVGWNYLGSISNSYATGVVTGTGTDVGGLVGWDPDEGTSNSFYDKYTTGRTDTGKGDPKTTAEMKTLGTFQSAGWTIVAYDPNTAPTSGWFIRAGSYPQLYWEWAPPAPEPGRNFNFNNFEFTLLPLSSSGSVLTAISGKGANPMITPAFVTGGSAADLGRAVAAYNQAKQSFEANKGAMNAADKAVAEVELAVANAAILALDLSLAAQSGQAFDMAALISAYNNALAVLNANRALLTAEQIAEAEALLDAVSTVISRFSS